MNDQHRNFAVVIGNGLYNDLGLIRSCGEAGMKVVFLSPVYLRSPIDKSRYVDYWLSTYLEDSTKVIYLLKDLDKYNKNSRFFVFPAGDKAAILFDRIKTELPENFIIPSSSKYCLENLMDKALMTQLAKESGLNPPNSEKLLISESTQFKPSFPLIAKPLASAYGEKADISICRNDDDWNNAIERFKSHGTEGILVQNLIKGSNQCEIAVTGVSLPSGEIMVKGYIEKIRTHGNGSTTFGIYHPENIEVLEENIIRFIKATGYTGIFDIEFMKNDDGYHFIECNFRNGAYGYAVTRGGFNMPAAFAGVDVKESKGKRIVFMEERTDVLNVLDGSMRKSQWIKDFLRSDCLLWWNWRDMRPFIYHNWIKFRSRFCSK